MEKLKKEDLILDDTVKQNKKGEAILGRLTGAVADVVNPTRNGRKYTDALWKKVFNDPIVKEYFEAGGLLGELNHPSDRLETDLKEVAVCMPEPPKEGKDGKLYATLDILDTPNGRILYTLAKYGYKLGISSRGNGETYQDYNGDETVDEDSYELQAWDIVLLPAVKAARLNLVTESLNKTFKQALTESLNKAKPEEKEIMQNTIDRLHLFESNVSKTMAVNDVKASVVKQLQEALKDKQQLEEQVAKLQEKLSVCYTKENKYEESIATHKQAVKNLSEKVVTVNELTDKVSVLTKKVKSLTNEVNTLSQLNEKKDLQIKQLQTKKLNESNQSSRKEQLLQEHLNKRTQSLRETTLEIKELKEAMTKKEESFNKTKTSLKEDIISLKQDMSIQSKNYKNKLQEAVNLTEKYKKIARQAINKYIDSQALKMGIDATAIKKNLPENYSFADIDRLCEEASNYNLRVSNLPFSINSKVKVKAKQTKLNEDITSSPDGDVDELTLTLAGLKV